MCFFGEKKSFQQEISLKLKDFLKIISDTFHRLFFPNNSHLGLHQNQFVAEEFNDKDIRDND